MKNTIKWLGIIALVAVIGFSFSTCGGDDGGNGDNNNNNNNNTEGEGKTITVSLNKINSTTFSLIVDGAKFSVSSITYLIRDDDVTVYYSGGSTNTLNWTDAFNMTESSDTRYTYTLKTSNYTRVTGTIRLYSNLNRAYFKEIGSKDTIVVSTSSITF
jgi:hypothetical protein